MDRAKIVAFVLLVALCLSLPLLWLLLLRPDRSLPRDYSTFSYFAVTGNGQEYIYAPGEDGFLMAADAFSHAVAADAPAWYREDAPKMLLEWIEGDRAHQYMLYLSASPMAAYLTDDRGGGYLLRRVDAIRFFAGEGAPAPEGEEPPTFTVGGGRLAPLFAAGRIPERRKMEENIRQHRAMCTVRAACIRWRRQILHRSFLSRRARCAIRSFRAVFRLKKGKHRRIFRRFPLGSMNWLWWRNGSVRTTR